MGWRDLSPDERDTVVERRKNESVEDLASEYDMPVVTLDRRIREWKAKQNGGSSFESKDLDSEELNQLFQLLKRGPISLRGLSEKLDRSEKTVNEFLVQMEEAGYALDRTECVISVGTLNPANKPRLIRPVIDDQQQFTFGVVSDIQCGSICCQPTHLNRFIHTAVEEYGVRKFLVPGDITTGIFGYKGHIFDMIPKIRPESRAYAFRATHRQIWLADKYIPKIDGVDYYMIGGNHDWWHVVHSGLDAVYMLANDRDDIHFLGYDVADVPLTENIVARMWHPSGGVPYALSYRLQKNAEQIAFEELSKLISDDLPPKVRFLLSGHLHVEVKFQRGPLTASQVGCFEGQTNYLKRKGLYPSIGGQIWDVTTEDDEIRRVGYTFISYPEIYDDWKNWPVPSDDDILGETDEVEILFSLKE